jgi:hypothetical protein
MDKNLITPEESLLLISKTIEETKRRFKAGGHIYIFWGCLMFIVTLSQFILIQKGLSNRLGFPALLYPLGAIFTFIYYRKKFKNLPRTIIGNILQAIGWLLGANLMILGFLFFSKLGEAMVPVFLIFLAIFTIITGVAIKFKPLILGGIVLNLIAFATFYFKWEYHPLLMSAGAVIAFIIPGLLLNQDQKK